MLGDLSSLMECVCNGRKDVRWEKKTRMVEVEENVTW